MKKIYLNDIILNIAIVVLCIAVPVCLWLTGRDENKRVIVSHDGQTVFETALEKSSVFEYDGVTVNVADGTARITHSDCPDGLCLKMKKAENVGDSIICVPNKVSVKIVGEGETEVDVVAR